ncbi:MAG: hypothetical protein ACPGWM_07820, partial [Flavobacteriales bacterium]
AFWNLRNDTLVVYESNEQGELNWILSYSLRQDGEDLILYEFSDEPSRRLKNILLSPYTRE